MKNHLLNMEKGLAAIFVVLIHCKFPGTVGDIAESFARFAVPLFFMVSGYFSYKPDREKVAAKLPKKIIHILKLTIYANIIYIIYDMIVNYFDGTISIWIYSIFSPISLIQIFITNSFFSSHLWFMFALIACYIILAIVNKLNIYKLAYILVPITLICHFSLSQFGYKFYPDMPAVVFRNFALFGFPFFMLGNLIAKNKDKIISKFSDAILIFLFILGSAEAIAKRLIFHGKEELFIGSLIAVCAMFIFAIKNGKRYKENTLARLGDKSSLDIYIMQWIVIGIVEFIMKKSGIFYGVYLYLEPLAVIVICIIISKIIRFDYKNKLKK